MRKATLFKIWEKTNKNLLDKEFKFDAPILTPEKKKIQEKKIPEIVEKTTETISDWLDWLKTVEDESVKRRISPRAEKLKKKNFRLMEI